MKKFSYLIGVMVLVFGLASAFKTKTTVRGDAKPNKVILIIGDGMGLAQISSALSFFNGQNAFERFPVIGLSKTSSADNYVTDSGAGATVFSIGKKTFNGAIGVDKDSLIHEGLFELMKRKQMATGVVVTSSITHATPAAFYAHVASRRSEDDIADFLLKGNCDIAIGGGLKFLVGRTDHRNLHIELNKKGFATVADTLNTYIHQNATKLVYTLAWNGMKTMRQGRGDYLKKASLNAMELLTTNPNGYMLMIEGSQIDWGGHDNNFEYMKAELLDLNDAMNAVLDEAKKQGDILVVVTADHETGGLALLENSEDKSRFKISYSTGGHSGIMVPVFAYGPGSSEFSGIYENTDIHYKLKRLMGL